MVAGEDMPDDANNSRASEKQLTSLLISLTNKAGGMKSSYPCADDEVSNKPHKSGLDTAERTMY